MESKLPADGPQAPSVTVKDLDAHVAKIAELRKEIEASEAHTTTLNKQMMQLKAKAVACLRELNREDYKSPFGSISLKPVWTVKMPQEDRDKQNLFDWMREKGIYDKYATVNAASLKSLILAERQAFIDQGGDPLLFSVPGVEPPKMFEDLGFRKA
jgi:hypothetical protein